MKIDVRDDFVNLLMGLDKSVGPDHVIKALKWASDSPEKAAQIVEGWRKLRSNGMKEFQGWLSLGLGPDRALECAEKFEVEQYEQLSFLRKVIARAKKGGYTFTSPNGVECTIDRRGEGEYWFNFNLGGEEVYLVYSGTMLSYVIKAIKGGWISTHGLIMIVYNDKGYEADSTTGRKILKAVERNLNPKVLAVVDPELR